jgi:hypothetical protein
MDNLNPILWGYLMDSASWFRQTDDNTQARLRREWSEVCKGSVGACAQSRGAFSPVAALVGLVGSARHRIARAGRAQVTA